jgi:hypothetical protein
MNRKWTQTGKWMVGMAVALAAGSIAWGQSSDAKDTSARSGDVTVQEAQSPAVEPELGIIALQRIAKADKYAFVFFFRADDERTQSMRKALESAAAEIPDDAEVVAVDVTDPLESGAVKKFGVSRAPMPLILAVAPTGAITKNWFRNFDGKQLDQAFVSTGEAKCLKALQGRKMVLVCVQNGKTTHNDEAMQGVNEFNADRLYAARTAVVSIDPTDESEAGFLKKLRVTPETEEAVTVLMAPPGRPVATFTGATNKADIIAATKKAGSGCDPKSGCCSKKPAAKPTGGEKKP